MSYRSRQRLRQKERQRAPVPSHEGRRVDDYVRLPYRVTLDRDDEGGKPSWVASVDDLPGCTSRGRTPENAVSGVSDALAAWIEAAIREGREVPEPRSRQSHSGRLLLRMPQTLHAELSRVAEREGASLNQLITDVLAGTVGWRAPGQGLRAEASAPRPAIQRLGEELLDELGDDSSKAEPHADSRSTSHRRSRYVTAALVANFVLVALAAVVAILVLIAAWR